MHVGVTVLPGPFMTKPADSAVLLPYKRLSYPFNIVSLMLVQANRLTVYSTKTKAIQCPNGVSVMNTNGG